MTRVKFIEALITNGFKVIEDDGIDINYNDSFLLTIKNGKVAKLDDAVTELSEYKYGQLLYLIKKYQNLVEREAVTQFD